MSESSSLPPKTFEAPTCESHWLKVWKEGRYFEAQPLSDKPPFCIVIPPPNVTGVLHMGHALVNTLQDIVCRWKRMSGFDVLWVPGTDHAGIATQTVVERHLMTTTGRRRTEMDREEFLRHTWEWKEQYGSHILEQLEKLGCSCDWSRLRFTLDETCSQAVRAMFSKLYAAGLIYRGEYLVNWDPVTQTALANDEVEYEEVDGYLWTLAYPLANGSGEVCVATSRPETMLGDVAVAVHPDDPRYAKLIGQSLKLPLSDRLIPIIADHRIDREFGTGAVKITPAHDQLDWEIGRDHALPIINVMTHEAKLSAAAGRFAGLTREEGREAVVEAIKALGLLRHTEKVKRRVGVSYRSKAVIEPHLSLQWFVKLSAFKDRLTSIVKDGEVTLIPSTWDSTYYHWINNLRDWCISRQLWWGHRIPVWYKRGQPEEMLVWGEPGVPPQVAADPDGWIQDTDVLDTWFSSALWPFSTLGWPEATPEMARYYPNSMLITGWDILFFWVARMLMAGEFALNEPPFPKVFLHGLIYGKSYWRDGPHGSIQYVPEAERTAYDLGTPPPAGVHSRWEKMSKSKGNVINPLEIAETYGTDAMRFALVMTNPQARQIDLDRRRFEDTKHFMNKLWNGARFVFMQLTGEHPLDAATLLQGIQPSQLDLCDQWVLHKLTETVHEVNRALEHCSFDQAAQRAYDFFWNEFCSTYIETAKPHLHRGTPAEIQHKQRMLVILLTAALRILHPMVPFVTEELFAQLKRHFGEITLPKQAPDLWTMETLRALQAPVCAVAPFPQVAAPNQGADTQATFDFIQRVVYTLRNIRGEMRVPPGLAIEVLLSGSALECALVIQHRKVIESLVRITGIQTEEAPSEQADRAVAVVGSLRIAVPLPSELRSAECERLEKEVVRLEGLIAKSPLQRPDFAQRAPAALVEQHRTQLQTAQQELQATQTRLAALRQ
ncbi:MAG: valine--tRNA ligase [Chlamydiia bacterium]